MGNLSHVWALFFFNSFFSLTHAALSIRHAFKRVIPHLSVKVNKLSSIKTQLPYEYYCLKYCKPSKILNSAKNLGEVLRGTALRILCICDEAVASFLEADGQSLTELSLNHVQQVGPNTSLALSRCSRNLTTLDLSFCRELTDEALGPIADSCSSLRIMKIFGCIKVCAHFTFNYIPP